MKTIFEKIIAREIPAYIIYEDDLVISFLDISQITTGHTLVVPKIAYKNLFELPENLACHIMKVTVNIANALKLAFNTDQLNLINNNGSLAGQEVFHFHLHLIPRYAKEEIIFKHENNFGKISTETFTHTLQKIKAVL